MHADGRKRDNDIVAWFAARQSTWTIVVAALWIGGMFWLSADQDYTSGELLDHLLAWTGGEPLYSNPQQLPYRVLNYPPLGMALARGFSMAGVSALLAGRLVGTLGVVVALWVVYGWMREMGVARTPARATIALSGLSFPLLYSTGQFHLEGFAVALSIGGARLLWRGTSELKRSVAAAQMSCMAGGALAALACFVKQTQVLSLLVLLAWLVVRNRRRFLPFAGTALIAAAAGAALMYWWFGVEAWRQLTTYTVGTYSLDNLSFQLVSHALPWLAFALAAWYHTFSRDPERQSLLTWYLVGTSLLLLTSARNGSGFQYFLEWQLVVLCLLGPAIEQLAVSLRARSNVVVVVAGAALVAMNLTVDSFLFYNWRTARNTQLAFQELCALVPKAPLFTPTESPGAARACGARPALHPFIIANLTKRGLWDERAFVADLKAGRYAALLLPFDPETRVTGVHLERWSPAVLDAMRAAYHPLQVDGEWRLLVPVRGAPSNSVDR